MHIDVTESLLLNITFYFLLLDLVLFTSHDFSALPGVACAGMDVQVWMCKYGCADVDVQVWMCRLDVFCRNTTFSKTNDSKKNVLSPHNYFFFNVLVAYIVSD